MVIHHLKVWPEFYKMLDDGSKTWEVRYDDRGYAVKDILVFHEWDPMTGSYVSSPLLYAMVLYLWYNIPGLLDGHVIMDLSLVRRSIFASWNATRNIRGLTEDE
jgi:hypothetical protein